ncbi:TPA: hypothetical protein OEI43_004568 [Escherichia coli]|uniref:hypothetical protein n=1 Tax=Escherichia coli TaxID=562 RepID=UPI0013CF2CD8|nr:hypothetical protein [Escherichia coli]HCP5720341.1 hypothetical protein [Escherichia coli]
MLNSLYGHHLMKARTEVLLTTYKQRLPVRNPSPLATPEALNQSWSVPSFSHVQCR